MAHASTQAPGQAPTQAGPPAAGPLLQATLIVGDLQPLQRAYAALGLGLRGQGRVDAKQALAWRQPTLEGRSWCELGSPDPEVPALLRLIEIPGAGPRSTRMTHGWLALEILVRDVDALAPRVAAAGFEIVGPPADLDVSPAIRAMQAIGPAGEMLYLTQVRQPVPPFDIPLSSSIPKGDELGGLFIAVMSAAAREDVILACSALHPLQTLRFDTRITVLNRAWGHPLDKRWPVATLQWAGACLFEIDEVAMPPGAVPITPPEPGRLPEGLAWVSMRHAGFPLGDAAQPAAASMAQASLRELSPGAWLELLP